MNLQKLVRFSFLKYIYVYLTQPDLTKVEKDVEDERVLEAERKAEIRKRIEDRKKMEGRADEDADDEDEADNGQMPGRWRATPSRTLLPGFVTL